MWTVTRSPRPVFHYCGRAFELPTASPDIELTLVNGWVWVNDVNQGGIWFVREEELEVEQVTDWTAALHLNDAEEIVEESAGGDEEEVENPEADDLAEEVDALDDDDRNEPPVANDDEADARRGQAAVVDVLLNDVDEDHDPLAVESLTGARRRGLHRLGRAGDDHRRRPRPSRSSRRRTSQVRSPSATSCTTAAKAATRRRYGWLSTLPTRRPTTAGDPGRQRHGPRRRERVAERPRQRPRPGG